MSDFFKLLGERRFKIVNVDQQFLIEVLNWWRNPPDFLALPRSEVIPDDAVVVDVSFSWERRCFGVLIVSRDFAPVAPGAVIEVIPGLVTEMRHVSFEELRSNAANQRVVEDLSRIQFSLG